MDNIERVAYRHDMLYEPDRIVIRVCNLDGAGSVEREVEYVPAERLRGAVDRVADALRDEFATWITGHPNAAIFDWNVAAENILRATTNQGAVEALETIRDWRIPDGNSSCATELERVKLLARTTLGGQ